MATRVLAFLGALALLALFSLGSLGVVLLAPVGMLVYDRVQRSRGKTPSMAGTWLVACSSVAIGFIALAAAAASMIPRGEWNEFQRTVDSTSAATPPRPAPEWLERMQRATPGGAAVQAVPPVKFGSGAMIFGGIFLLNVMAGVMGSAGWLGGILLWQAATGRKPWTAKEPAQPLATG